MSFFPLPKTNIFSFKFIECIEQDEILSPAISNSLSCYLYEIKEKLDKCEKDWDVFKKYTNPYEYIHTSIPLKKKCIAKYKPLSRSYFKMIEMVHSFALQFDSKPIRTFHLAEGPGGFIEAILNLRNCPHDFYIGMTIIDEENNPNVPGWKKTEYFLNQNKNVYIEKGADGTGNILSLSNLIHCRDKYASSMNLITADGGFDFSLDFNSQEVNIARLLFAQICFAITMQKKNGCFILKIFDCFMQHTVDLIYILSSFYDKVYIIKPHTSRHGNSERYIVCKNFIHSSCESFFQYIYKAFEKMSQIPENKCISRFLNIPVPYYFLMKLEEFNAILGQQQIENIHFTISLIDNKHKQEKIDSLIKTNIQKSIQWCVKHNVPHEPVLYNSSFLFTPFNNHTF
jgi:23S rRNA U2552 (ribose-2'-O)-methylase RlmE/FtsJ